MPILQTLMYNSQVAQFILTNNHQQEQYKMISLKISPTVTQFDLKLNYNNHYLFIEESI
jgi:hypothetical protein